MTPIFAAWLVLGAGAAGAESFGPYEPPVYPDVLRMRDLLSVAENIEAYYKKTQHFPFAGEPQAEVSSFALTDYKSPDAPPRPGPKELEKELKSVLGPQVKVNLDPSEGFQGTELRIYQYASDGQDYYISAVLSNHVFYARRLDDTHYLVELTSHPNQRDAQYKPSQIRHYMKYGPDRLARQMPLAIALANKDYAAAKMALADGANPSPPCEFQTRCQPLADAAQKGDIETMTFLLDNGADIDGYTAYYDVALTSALGAGKRDAVTFLLERGADVNLPNAFGITPFIGAIASGDIEMARLMLAKGGNVNRRYQAFNSEAAPGETGDRPLEAAILSRNPDLVDMLLKAGADPSLTGKAGAMMLDLARGTGNDKIVKLVRAASE